MLKKFVAWFIVLALSFFVSDVLHWTEQGKAFFYMHFVFSLIILLLAIIFIANSNVPTYKTKALILLTALEVFIVLFATWGATKIYDVNFVVAYQLMTFGQCLCNTDSKKRVNHNEL